MERTMTFKLFWIREDCQGDYDMGEYPTEEAAEAAIPAMKRELISQCPGPSIETSEDFTRCRDEVLAGHWDIQKVEEEVEEIE